MNRILDARLDSIGRQPTLQEIIRNLRADGFRHDGNVDRSDPVLLADALSVGPLVTHGVLNVVVLDFPTDDNGNTIDGENSASIWVREDEAAQFIKMPEPERCFWA